MTRRVGGLLLAAMWSVACDPGGEGPPDQGAPLTEAELAHAFEPYALGAGQERTPCLSWTLDNDEALWVQGVTLDNDGFFHHSNWFVVPEDRYAGPDGFWDCASRGFDQVGAALAGTVLGAQSTQSRHEVQRFPPGAVVKIPPRHKVVAGAHLLNTSTLDVATVMRVGLSLVHPSRVDTLLIPFHLDNRALAIPPEAESRFTLTCDLASAAQAAGAGLDVEIRYVLPHFHYLANFWSLEVVGGEEDGRLIHTLPEGFAGDAGGLALDPPVDLGGAQGLVMTCGYRNDRAETVGWGIGDQEMCEMLGLAESSVLYDARAVGPSRFVGTEGGRQLFEADCEVTALPPNAAQALPSAAELEAPLYVPDSRDPGLVVSPACEDTPAGAPAAGPATLQAVTEAVFTPSCAFNACHAGATPAAGLSLADGELHATLVDAPARSHADLPLVSPGDPEGSWLYQRISRCEPLDHTGGSVSHMPLNSPRLLDPGLVAQVRDWIASGAAP